MKNMLAGHVSRTLIAAASVACAAALSVYSTNALALDVTTVSFSGPNGVQLSGVLYTPTGFALGGADEYAAVVMLHGCSGMWSNRDPTAVNGNGTPNLQNQIEKWGLQLATAGHVALAVDSYTPREPADVDTLAERKDWQNQCSGQTYGGAVDPYTTRVLDARSAYAYLTGDTRIDTARVGLLGWSQGSETAMIEAAETSRTTDTARAAEDRLFSTTVVFYPGCGSSLGFGSPSTGYWRPYVDFRLNVGDQDSFYANCNARTDRAVDAYGGDPADPEVVFAGYAGAAHSFDGVAQTWPTAVCSGSNPTGDTCAMKDADIESLAFFADKL